MAERQEKKDFLGDLRLGSQITEASQLTARGVLILTGLLLLLADRVLELVGARAPLAVIAAFIVVGLTLLNVLELLGGSGERGGTYILIHEELPGWVSFLAGWGILAGCLTLTAALAQLAARILLSWLPIELTVAPVATGILTTVVLVQFIRLLPQRFPFRLVAFGLVAVLVALLISLILRVDLRAFTDSGRFSFASFNRSVAWLVVIYAAFESILISRRRVQEYQRQIPRSMGQLSVVGGLLAILLFFIFAGVRGQTGLSSGRAILDLLASGFLAHWITFPTLIFILVLAVRNCLMTAARQAFTFSQEGAFPKVGGREGGHSSIPLSLFSLLGFIAVPLVWLLPVDWLVYTAAFWFLLAMTALNVAAIYSRRTEKDRRRIVVLPFAPLIPASAIVFNLVLMAAIPWQYSAAAAVWLIVGLGVYFLYARTHQLQADEGEKVFGTGRLEKTREKFFRILVPIGKQGERHLVLRIANALARQISAEVVPLQVIEVPDPLAIEEGRRLARERNTLFRWSVRAAGDMGVPVSPVTRLARTISDGIIETAFEEECDLLLLAWPIQANQEEPQFSSVLSRVSRSVTCDIAVIAYHPAEEFGKSTHKTLPREVETNSLSSDKRREESRPGELSEDGDYVFKPRRILVPTAGGPHAPLAIRLAVLLANEYDATVQATYISPPDAVQEQIQAGQERIQETIEALRDQVEDLNVQGMQVNGIKIHGKVVRAENVVAGIVSAGQQFDLVLLGASEESLIDQFLFGNLPEQVARESKTPVVIVKRYRGLPRQWLRRAWDTAYESLPTLGQEEQLDIYRKVYRDARPDVDFFIMMGLSTLIATAGLVQNSVAVIIGAMLVAPLFSPLLGISLALAVGSVRLLRIGIEAMLKGVALSLGVATLVAWILPLGVLGSEVTARTQPNLLDLAVALAAGAAGAYAIARKDVAAALPGVAIAAALVPPLAVVGIGLATGDLQVMGGSSLLLVTNLVAIVLAAVITLLLLGFRPGSRMGSETPLRRGLLATFTLAVLVTIPLAVFFYQSVSLTSRDQQIQRQVATELAEIDSIELVDPQEIRIRRDSGTLIVTVPVYSGETPPSGLAEDLQRNLQTILGEPVGVQIVTFLTLDVRPPEEGTP